MCAVLSRADRQARTRSELIDAGERLFIANGFHATSIDAVAAEAGYTKGAVYSNFASKEDLFFAIYERRVERRGAEMRSAIESAPTARAALEQIIPGGSAHTPSGDGWLAVFFEFWAHVLRHPELRERFAELHGRVIGPLAEGVERLAREEGYELADDPSKLATARYAMQLGLQLERLTRPELVDAELALRVTRFFTDEGGRDGI